MTSGYPKTSAQTFENVLFSWNNIQLTYYINLYILKIKIANIIHINIILNKNKTTTKNNNNLLKYLKLFIQLKLYL